MLVTQTALTSRDERRVKTFRGPPEEPGVGRMSLTAFPFPPQRLIQYLASRNTLFNLNNFLDKGALQGNATPTATSRDVV